MYALIVKKQGGNKMQIGLLIFDSTIFTRRGSLVVERQTPERKGRGFDPHSGRHVVSLKRQDFPYMGWVAFHHCFQ